MKQAWNGLHDMNRLEWASLAPLVILVVLLGLYPAPILEATAEPVERILETVQAASGLDLVAWPW
jgi:NADH-quinone oxidoreductase subunit M